jgi:hypothetical protein
MGVKPVIALFLVSCAGARTVAPVRQPDLVSTLVASREPPRSLSSPVEQSTPADEPEPEASPCPSGPAVPSDGSPSFIVDRVSDLYEALVGDYLDANGQFGDPIRNVPREQADRAICAALGKDGYSVFGKMQEGGTIARRGPVACVGKEKQSLYISRFIWEFSQISFGKYLATRTARVGSPDGAMYSGHSIETEERDGVVLTTVTTEAWKCPFDQDDPCGSFDVEGTGTTESRCLTDGETACAAAGFYSAVYVTDVATNQTLMFGEFQRVSRPMVSVTSEQVTVNAGECAQSAKRPWERSQ